MSLKEGWHARAPHFSIGVPEDMKFFATVGVVLAALASDALASDANPANGPIYYGRPNNGGIRTPRLHLKRRHPVKTRLRCPRLPVGRSTMAVLTTVDILTPRPHLKRRHPPLQVGRSTTGGSTTVDILTRSRPKFHHVSFDSRRSMSKS